MPRRAKGPRLYLRTGRIDGRTGKAVADAWFIRDGTKQLGTGCGPDGVQEAEQALADYITAKWSAPARRPVSRSDPAQVLVSEVLALYADEVGAGDLDEATFEVFIRNLLDWWAERTIAEVRRSTCQAYVEKRCQDPDRRYKDPAAAPRVSSSTASRELDVLSSAIGHWHGEDTLTTRPVVWHPEKPESPRDALTRSQAAALLLAAMGRRKDPVTGLWTRLPSWVVENRRHLRRFLLICLYTGPRQNVVVQMQWTESADRPCADVDKGLIYRRGKAERDKATKRRPIVKLPRRLRAHMRRWRLADLARAAETQARVRAGEDGVKPFANTVIHHGGRALKGRVRTGFEGIVRDAGLASEITPHWMRHTAATWLMEAGVDTWEAAAFVGMTVATLEKHYAHHRPDYQDDAATGIVSGKVSGKHRRA